MVTSKVIEKRIIVGERDGGIFFFENRFPSIAS